MGAYTRLRGERQFSPIEWFVLYEIEEIAVFLYQLNIIFK